MGSFTLVDGELVSEADLGSNFFVTAEDVGKPRAEVVKTLLLELNPDSTAEHRVASPSEFITPGCVAGFQLVLASDLLDSDASALCADCERHHVPLILMWTVGFVARVRLFHTEHPVVQSHPETELGDLRLTAPFPELADYAASIDLAALDDQQHAHVPYVVLLMLAHKQFGTALPKTREEKDQFKQILKTMQRSDKEVNFEEAVGSAYKGWTPYALPGGVRAVLDEAAGVDVASVPECNTGFWVAAKAVAQFVKATGKLPLAGALPDMTADTDSYVQLQTLFQKRAEEDSAAVQASAQGIATAAGVALDAELVTRFCRHAQEVELFRFRSFAAELAEPAAELLCEEAADEESEAAWYVAMRAAQAFRERHGRYAGDCADEEAEAEIPLLLAEMTALAESLGFPAEGLDQKAGELVRYGSAVLHCTASVVGGVAAQEAVKLLTGQFTPLNNTWIYNGVKGGAQTLEL